MGLIFISHVAEDATYALSLAQGLEEAGLATWYYERDTLPGPSYLDQIMQALAQTDVMVVLVSPVALGSWQADKEVVRAHERGLPFIPLLIGLSHEEVQARRPAWAMAFGAAVSVRLTGTDVSEVLPGIVAGVRWLTRQRTMTPVPSPVDDSHPSSVTATAGIRQGALASPARPRDRLPSPPTPFIGREREVEAVCRRLLEPATRLLTLTGVGGTGKTRLALQAAAAVRDAFPDGVFFITLAPVSDPNLVMPTIARTLGVIEEAARATDDAMAAAVQDHVRDARMLLVLDNFEHLAGAAPRVSELLGMGVDLKVLVTSRAVLHVQGERDYPVPPLELPDMHDMPPLQALARCEAVRLFVARAQDVQPDFTLTDEVVPAVAQICARLDGLPLAIELVAARIRLLPPQALLRRLGSRLTLVTGRARDLPARQQTLRATIDWSYQLLGSDEQAVFARLAVFAGGCTLEAAETVCNLGNTVDVLGAVEILLEQSLLRQEGDGSEPRLSMLETIHEYARERLEESGEADAVRQRFAEYFLACAEQGDLLRRASDQVTWLERMMVERDNIRAALAWAVEQGKTELAVGLAGASQWFWADALLHADHGSHAR